MLEYYLGNSGTSFLSDLVSRNTSGGHGEGTNTLTGGTGINKTFISNRNSSVSSSLGVVCGSSSLDINLRANRNVGSTSSDVGSCRKSGFAGGKRHTASLGSNLSGTLDPSISLSLIHI